MLPLVFTRTFSTLPHRLACATVQVSIEGHESVPIVEVDMCECLPTQKTTSGVPMGITYSTWMAM